MPRAEIDISPTVKIVVDAPEGMGEADTQKAIIEGVAFWQSLPTICPMPGCNAPLHFTVRHPQNFHYYGLRCEGPKPHEMNLGERKDGTSLYVKEDGWKDAYGGGGQQAEEPAGASGQASASVAPAGNSPTGDKVDAGFVRMLQAVANGKNPKPDLDSLANGFFGKKLDACTKDEGTAVLEYLKSL